MNVDWNEVAQDLVRALRGRSTQTALSRRLGYTTNVIYRWESGQRKIRVSELFRILHLRRDDYVDAFWSFAGTSRSKPDLDESWDWLTWIRALRGSKAIEPLAGDIEVTPSALRRVFRGESDPTVARFLAIIQSLTGRIIDYIEIMVDASKMISIRPYWQVVNAQRKIASEHLNAEAIIAALEIEGYRDLPTHSDEWIAGRLALPVEEIKATVSALEDAGAIQLIDGAYKVQSHRHVNTRIRPEAWTTLSRFWAERGLELDVDYCRRGYLVFSANEEAIQTVRDIYISAHYQAVKAIQEGLNPTRVVAISTQFAFLDGRPKPP